jgi:hypothetical protein
MTPVLLVVFRELTPCDGTNGDLESIADFLENANLKLATVGLETSWGYLGTPPCER